MATAALLLAFAALLMGALGIALGMSAKQGDRALGIQEDGTCPHPLAGVRTVRVWDDLDPAERPDPRPGEIGGVRPPCPYVRGDEPQKVEQVELRASMGRHPSAGPGIEYDDTARQISNWQGTYPDHVIYDEPCEMTFDRKSHLPDMPPMPPNGGGVRDDEITAFGGWCAPIAPLYVPSTDPVRASELEAIERYANGDSDPP